MGQTVHTHVVAIFPLLKFYGFILGSALGLKNILHTLQLLPIKLIRRTEIFPSIVLFFMELHI